MDSSRQLQSTFGFLSKMSCRIWLVPFLFFVINMQPAWSSSESATFPYETERLSLDKGEYQRLINDYPVNRELIRSIGSDYYQIVNVVQLRHHQYLGLSTREGNSKSQRSQPQGMQATQQLGRTGKHYHRTSFIIQAFNHKFRLILELNTPLIAPNVLQKHIFSGAAEQRERNELEMCYYHGNVEGLEWSAAAVRTCNGLSGIIHMGNETFIIHPFYGGDLSNNHPHIVFEAKSVGRQTCGNKRGFEWNMPSGLVGGSSDYVVRRGEDKGPQPQYFIELAILLDRAMFDKRNGSTRLQVIHDALQIVNIADLYFRKLNTAISVVYVETWHQNNHLGVDRVDDLRQTLVRLTDYYGPRSLFSVNKDSTMLISGINFSESGMGVPMSICTPKAMGVITDVSIYQPHITGVALAHMIGHNLNMGHDQDASGDGCHCPNWYGCIMSEKIVGQDGIQPYRFSDCSRKSYFTSINSGHAMCLINMPGRIDPIHKTCGNGVTEPGEECDCGSLQECAKDPCCEPLVCRLKTSAQCSTGGPCCENCRFKGSDNVCRPKQSECDIPEYCTGQSGECPLNTYKKNGAQCGKNEGYCFNGYCPTLDGQCKHIWDVAGRKADDACYQQFNMGGHYNGHCGRDVYGGYLKCTRSNMMCGSLQCQDGTSNPILQSTLSSTTVSRIVLTLDRQEHECKNLNSPKGDSAAANLELVRDGTRCGEEMICMNQTCVKLANYMDNTRCPSNHVGLECSGHGDCSNVNICHCFDAWEGSDCSTAGKELPTTERPATPLPPIENSTNITTSANTRVTTKNSPEDGSNTIILVFGMVSVVGGVFILFAMMALCYRRSTTPKFETAPYPPFNPKTFKLPQPPQPTTHQPPQPPQLNHEEIDNRILSLTQLPTYRFRDQHNMGMTGSMKNLGNLGGGHPQDDETGDETSAFLGISPNSVGGNRGILKKYVEEDGSQSDNNEGLCEVERTLKSLNGYHEDILAALRVAAAQRGLGDANATPPPQVFNQGGTRLSSDGYPEFPDFSSEFPLLRNSSDRIPQPVDDESNDDGGGPIRIRNLEDLLRQLEHHSGNRHLSPCGSEDIRMSETEADRHYRRDLGGDDEGFVSGRYRGPIEMTSNRRPSPSDYGHFAAAAAIISPDDLESCIDGYASPFSCPCVFCNQQNMLHTSTSEDEEERTQVSRSLTPRNLKHLYNPSDESFGSQSPLHLNGSGPFKHLHPQRFPEYKH
ncbi:disintegrin and metalloproteinase domain-containing protein 11 isoform X4 [Folsomia candida]|uniref:disintegrin and metalloproteinase domain-containing protein 11 isoform X4 n=1 Tax=Folsomia candida TaxID=158441 RepID=UPI0016055758|nr:disintegrin and metalloproteinase domain-containing protein 11 isoform X4 [Folsomia candida]